MQRSGQGDLGYDMSCLPLGRNWKYRDLGENYLSAAVSFESSDFHAHPCVPAIPGFCR